jgi:glyoxylase-like metal-dependent hydrolase (beta-lactamase superfamily II)
LRVKLFNIANFKVDGGAMFGVVPKALWSRRYQCDDNNLVTLALRSLVVETGDRVILFDAGWGDKQDEKFFRHVHLHGGKGLIEGLSGLGYSPDDITDVVLTHLHADHCGGCVTGKTGTNDYQLVFRRAIHHVSRFQWEWASRNNPREADAFLEENIKPIADSGMLNLVDNDRELFSGVLIKIFHGHTPGMMIPVIDYNGKGLVYTGDLIPTLAHLPLVWNMSYDLDSLATIEEKKNILSEALEREQVLVFQHDENTECCTLQLTPKGIREKEKFTLSEITRDD